MGLPVWALVLNGVIAAAGLLGIAYALAVRFLHELQVHDLRLEVHRLRAEYEARMDAIRRGQVVTVEAHGDEKARAAA